MDDVVTRYQQAMCRKAADDLADLYAVDALHEIPFQVSGFPPRFEGRERIRAAYSAMWSATPVVIEQVEPPPCTGLPTVRRSSSNRSHMGARDRTVRHSACRASSYRGYGTG